MVTTSCDAGNRSSDCRRFSSKGAWCVSGGRLHRTSTRSWSAAWNNCGTTRPTGGGVRWSCFSQKRMPCVRRARRCTMRRCDTGCSARHPPCRKRVACSSQLAAEAARASASWLPSQTRHPSHSPSRVRTGGDQSGDRGSSIDATAG